MDQYQNSGATTADLKKQIEAELRPLIEHLNDPFERFNAYMSLLRDAWEDEIAVKAFNDARQIQKIEDKVYALQSLNSEISYRERVASGL